MEYAAVIYDAMNVIVRVEERPDERRARKAGEFYTKRRPGWWYTVAEGEDVIDMFKGLINA